MKTINLSELERLRRLKLNIKRSTSAGEGLRRSSAKGQSAEFSGYREYIPGDDMRYVDWNAYARLDKLFIKEYMEEKEGRVNIYLDTSKSMEFGDKLKSTLMAEITQAISFVAISNRDSVYVTDLGDSNNTIRVPSGQTGMVSLEKWLGKITPSGRIDLKEALKKSIKKSGGISIVLSDFMDEDFLGNEESIIRLFMYHRSKAVFVHILSEEEMNITDIGAFQFIDSEDEAREVRVTLDRGTIKDYDTALKNYIRDIKKKIVAADMEYVLCRTDEPLQKIIFENMRGLW
ncbi:MAG: DUF58 domain-containing protein [Eubacterium sp.]|nr:DUF58 domain-containing protein [Eubacterium sp.]